MQAIRSSGIGGIELVGAVVIETDGTLSVMARGQIGSGSALDDVQPAEGEFDHEPSPKSQRARRSV